MKKMFYWNLTAREKFYRNIKTIPLVVLISVFSLFQGLNLSVLVLWLSVIWGVTIAVLAYSYNKYKESD